MEQLSRASGQLAPLLPQLADSPVDFAIHFCTAFGQNITVRFGALPLSAALPRCSLYPVSVCQESALPEFHLQYSAGDIWRGRIHLPVGFQTVYKYILRTDSGASDEEESGPWRPLLVERCHLELRDTWRPPSPLDVFLTQGCMQSWVRRTASTVACALTTVDFPPLATPSLSTRTVRMQLWEPRIPPGGKVFIIGSIPGLGSWDVRSAIAMSDALFPLWTADVNCPPSDLAQVVAFEYKFLFAMAWEDDKSSASGTGSASAGSSRVPLTAPSVQWEEGSNRAFVTSSFVTLESVPLAQRGSARTPAPLVPVKGSGFSSPTVDARLPVPGAMVLRPPSPSVAAASVVPATGSRSVSVPAIGSSYPLPDATSAMAEFSATGSGAPPTPPHAEAGSQVGSGKSILIHTDNYLHGDSQLWKAAGMSIPLFAARAKGDMGVGEFASIKKLVDFARRAGLQLLHLCPVNDTTASATTDDSSPYMPLSAFALHPLYANIGDALSVATTARAALTPLSPADEAEADQIRSRLALLQGQLTSPTAAAGSSFAAETPARSKAQLEYEPVLRAKIALLRNIFRAFGDAVLASPAFAHFYRDNSEWLQGYALYCLFRDLHGCADPTTWGKRSTVTHSQIQAMCDPSQFYYKAITFWYFVQYVLHSQLAVAAAYARAQGVLLVSDVHAAMPAWSVDVWTHSHMFVPDVQLASAPGEGLPEGRTLPLAVYAWNRQDGGTTAWWRKRLWHLRKYFDGVKLVELESYFRSFVVPTGSVTGLSGRYLPAVGYTAEELVAVGVTDIARLTEPHVKEWTLRGALGSRWSEVIPSVMTCKEGNYVFRESLTTERRLHTALSEGPLRDCLPALLQLMNNSCLLIEKGAVGTVRYHPRRNMRGCSSYSELDETQQEVLQRLDHDYLWSSEQNVGAWRRTGQARLQWLKSLAPNLLILADDLGASEFVSEAGAAVGLICTRMHRVPQGPRSTSLFSQPSAYAYGTCFMPSTHDTPTLRGWWEDDRSLARKYWLSIAGHSGEAPDTCTTEVATDLIGGFAASPAMLLLLPIQDILAASHLRATDVNERVHVPSVPGFAWRYRMPMQLEELISESGSSLSHTLQQIWRRTGRMPLS